MRPSDIHVLPAEVANRVLALAGELDARDGDAVSVAHLRDSAVAAGIAPAAFDAALAKVAAAPHVGLPLAPWWVRACLIGVTDRGAAMAYYWFFALMLVLSPALLWLIPARHGSAQLVLPLLFAGWAFGSLWGTARAVRWLDRHGWDSLL